MRLLFSRAAAASALLSKYIIRIMPPAAIITTISTATANEAIFAIHRLAGTSSWVVHASTSPRIQNGTGSSVSVTIWMFTAV